MQLSSLTAISPIDGRYHHLTQTLAETFSEYALIRWRLDIEIRWLIALSKEPAIKEIPPLSKASCDVLQNIIDTFSIETAQAIKEIEQTTNHDVKAIEYFLKNCMQESAELKKYLEFVHFSCTSEDINNLAYALMLKDAREHQLLPLLDSLFAHLKQISSSYAHVPMLARTHGQPASPTTIGKEFAVFTERLSTQIEKFQQVKILGKFNGAVGNFNAHVVSYPEVNWRKLSQDFIQSLGLSSNNYTTQIEPHDWIAEYCQTIERINTVLIDCNRDIWGYISLDYFQQQRKEHEVGSSTMPHKVNPIDFENAEGNLGLANALYAYFAARLPISRWQRDLTDSTLLRNIGSAMGYSVIAYQAMHKGLKKLVLNEKKLQHDLEQNWEVLAEALQTVMRRYGIANPYEKLKSLTRGQKLTQEGYGQFVEQLELPENVKQQLKALTPETYIGLAKELALHAEK